mmetsp:Transcript_27698/g.54111  ORF Transcript_27698/g.54111 Transcript_27698/m.54111 type:complete len:296 (+) Transcript_27698:31-918(+)
MNRGGLLSKAERDFVEGGVEESVRSDGRERLAPRPVELKVGVVPQANGSCLLRCGGTRVLAGTKVELEAAEIVGRGKLTCSISCSMLASPMFEGRAGEDVSAELTRSMNQMMAQGMPKEVYSRLAVGEEGKQCWHVHCDASVLDYDGTSLDCCSMAIYAALANTLIPQVKVLLGTEEGAGPEIELMDSSDDCLPFDVSDVPIYTTLAQIGQRYVVDATHTEESCASARVSIAVNANGKLCASHKSEGRGLHPSQLALMLQAAQRIGLDRLETLKALVAHSNSHDGPDTILERPIF